MSLRYTTSRPCKWIEPRPKDARHMTHGRILPMEEEKRRGWLSRLFWRL